MAESGTVREFLSTLVSAHLNLSSANARIDFLACNAAQSSDGQVMARELMVLLKVSSPSVLLNSRLKVAIN